ncbi:hypothetical protein HZH68_012825 [Vespula germanica]|uniref:Uncharacterized protein n=1 Tax=Vespula germanica TaxID=30212 RepID=A0A834JEI2_VESGE|nr:hypothetical protein HZH68_012825 [Vespula germanica]
MENHGRVFLFDNEDHDQLEGYHSTKEELWQTFTGRSRFRIILKRVRANSRVLEMPEMIRKLEDASSGSGLVRVATLYSNGVASQRGPITPLRDVDSSYMSPVTFRACLRKDRDCA